MHLNTSNNFAGLKSGFLLPKKIPELPKEILQGTSYFLNPLEVKNLSEVSRIFNPIANSNTVWKNYLKPEVQKIVDPKQPNHAKELFKNPENRLDIFVPVDKCGINYLFRDNSITTGVIKYVKLGLLSVEQVHKTHSARRSGLDYPGVQKYIDNGQLQFEEVFRWYHDDRADILSHPAVQERIANGTLKPVQALCFNQLLSYKPIEAKVQEINSYF